MVEVLHAATTAINQTPPAAIVGQNARDEVLAQINSEISRLLMGPQTHDIKQLIEELQGLGTQTAHGMDITLALSRLAVLKPQIIKEIGEAESEKEKEQVKAGDLATQYTNMKLDAAAHARIQTRVCHIFIGDVESVQAFAETSNDPNGSVVVNALNTKNLTNTYMNTEAGREVIEERNKIDPKVKEAREEEFEKDKVALDALIAQYKGTGTAAEQALLTMRSEKLLGTSKAHELIEGLTNKTIDPQTIQPVVDELLANHKEQFRKNLKPACDGLSEEDQKTAAKLTDAQIEAAKDEILKDPKKYDALAEKKAAGHTLTTEEEKKLVAGQVANTATVLTFEQELTGSMKEKALSYQKSQDKSTKELTQDELRDRIFVQVMDMKGCHQFDDANEKAAYLQNYLLKDPHFAQLAADKPDEFKKVTLEFAQKTMQQGEFEAIVGVKITEEKVCRADIAKIADELGSQQLKKVTNDNMANGATTDPALKQMAEMVKNGSMKPDQYLKEMEECQDMYNAIMHRNMADVLSVSSKEFREKIEKLGTNEEIAARGVKIFNKMHDPNNKEPLTDEEKDIAHIYMMAKAKTVSYLYAIDPALQAKANPDPQKRIDEMVAALQKNDQFAGLTKDELTAVVTMTYNRMDQAKQKTAEKEKEQPAKDEVKTTATVEVQPAPEPTPNANAAYTFKVPPLPALKKLSADVQHVETEPADGYPPPAGGKGKSTTADTGAPPH